MGRILVRKNENVGLKLQKKKMLKDQCKGTASASVKGEVSAKSAAKNLRKTESSTSGQRQQWQMR
jgi:hypothetical protein